MSLGNSLNQVHLGLLLSRLGLPSSEARDGGKPPSKPVYNFDVGLLYYGMRQIAPPRFHTATVHQSPRSRLFAPR